MTVADLNALLVTRSEGEHVEFTEAKRERKNPLRHMVRIRSISSFMVRSCLFRGGAQHRCGWISRCHLRPSPKVWIHVAATARTGSPRH